MQSITTKFLAPTNTKGDRIKATCEAGTITAAWDYEFDSKDNHMAAADALRIKLGWNTKCYPDMVGGDTKDGMVFVFVKTEYTLKSEVK